MRSQLIHGLILVIMVSLLALPGQAMAAPLPGQGYVPFTAKNGCLDQRSATVFGMQVYTAMNSKSPYFPYLQNSGASWVRVPINWSAIQPDPAGAFNWGPADTVLNVANSGCANVIATIDMAPAWAQAVPESPRGPIKTAQMGNFVKFVQALVERYDGDRNADAPSGVVVNYWEFYNEPDFGRNPDEGDGWGYYGSQYAAMLKTVYQPVHTANANAQVVMGGIAFDAFIENGGVFVSKFLDDVLAAGGGSAFDVMNFHYYPAFRKDWTQTEGTGLPEKIGAIRQKLADIKLNKPLVITEAGWHSNSGDQQYPSSDEDQSRYVVQFFAQSVAHNIDFTIWWMLYDGLTTEGYQFANGLVTEASPPAPPVAKPAYKVYQAAVARIAQATFVAELDAAEIQNTNLEAYQFAEAYTGKRMFVAWVNPVTSQETRPLSISGGTATVYSKENTLQAVVRDGDDGAQDGKITVQVGASPLYIVMD